MAVKNQYKRACEQAFENLCELAGSQRSGSSPFLGCDLVHQEDLYDIQNEYSNILLMLATTLGKGDELVKRLPWAFQSKEVPCD